MTGDDYLSLLSAVGIVVAFTSGAISQLNKTSFDDANGRKQLTRFGWLALFISGAGLAGSITSEGLKAYIRSIKEKDALVQKANEANQKRLEAVINQQRLNDDLNWKMRSDEIAKSVLDLTRKELEISNASLRNSIEGFAANERGLIKNNNSIILAQTRLLLSLGKPIVSVNAGYTCSSSGGSGFCSIGAGVQDAKNDSENRQNRSSEMESRFVICLLADAASLSRYKQSSGGTGCDISVQGRAVVKPNNISAIDIEADRDDFHSNGSIVSLIDLRGASAFVFFTQDPSADIKINYLIFRTKSGHTMHAPRCETEVMDLGKDSNLIGGYIGKALITGSLCQIPKDQPIGT